MLFLQLMAGAEAPAVPAGLPKGLRELLGSCLALDPAARPRAADLAVQLRRVMLALLEQASRAAGGCRVLPGTFRHRRCSHARAGP